MESIAKYILYYNVNTRDLYDASGAFMGNTPFSVYFDNLISVELHYMEDTSSDSISGWVPWTALEGNTVGSSICFDDDYVHAKTGKIYADASVGDTSIIVHVSLDSEVVNPTGVLVVYKDQQNISVPYKGYVENANVYTFALENPLQIQLRQDDMVRVPQALLLKIDSDQIDSSRASQGIFSFNVHTLSHKLLNKLIYSGVSKISGVFEHQIVSDGNIVSTFTFDMVVNSLLGYEGQADIPKTGNWADKAYVDSKIITKTSELQNDAGFISQETDPVYTADKPNIALKSQLFSKQFSALLGIPTTIGGYGITDAFIQNRTVTIGNGSIQIPQITQQSVKQLLGVDSELGSSVRFLNERGQFTQIQSVMTVNGVSADINGNVQLNLQALVNMQEIAGYVKAVKSVNGVQPDQTLNVTITGDDINVVVFSQNEQTLNSFLYGVVTSVNEVTPQEGSITLYASNIPYNDTDVAQRLDYILQNMGTGAIKTINGQSPDSDGNIQLSFVKSVDGISPDSSGDIQLTVTIDGTSMSFYDAFQTLRYRIEQLEQNGGGSGDYTLTKAAVDSVIGASSTGSTAKFYNEQGAFTTVTGFLPLGGGTIDGDLQLNGTLYTDQSLLVSFRDTFTLGCYSTGGLPIEPDTVSELVLDKPNATAEVKLLYTKSESDINEAGLYLDAKSSMSDPSELYVPGFMKIWTGNDTVTVNQIFLRGALGILIKSNTAINIQSGTGYFRFNSKDVAVIDDITAHNEDATAHTDLFALKEDTGVAQGLVDAHNESDTVHEALFEAKADKTELENYLPLSGGTMTGDVFWNAETGFGIRYNDNSGTFGWSYGESTGSGIAFRGVGYNDRPGSFYIFARDATNTSGLTGTVEGTLTWGGNHVTALPGGYVGGTIYVGANRDIKTIADAIAYINRYSSGVNKKWTLKLDAGEYAIGLSVYGLWLAIEPASGSYSTACRLTGQITTDHFAVLEFTNMHFGGTANGTVNAGIYGKTSLIKCTNCTFYAGTSLTTSIQGDYGANFMLSGCKFYSPTTSFTNSWFQSIRVGGSCFVGIAGTTTFTGGGYSNSYAMVVYAGSYIHTGSGAITISNYKYGVNASQSGNAYVGSTITFNNVTTKFTPAQGAVGNGNSYIN